MHRLTKHLLSFNSLLIEWALKKFMYKPKMLVKLKPLVSPHFQYTTAQTFICKSHWNCHIFHKLPRKNTSQSVFEHTMNTKYAEISLINKKLIQSPPFLSFASEIYASWKYTIVKWKFEFQWCTISLHKLQFLAMQRRLYSMLEMIKKYCIDKSYCKVFLQLHAYKEIILCLIDHFLPFIFFLLCMVERLFWNTSTSNFTLKKIHT